MDQKQVLERWLRQLKKNEISPDAVGLGPDKEKALRHIRAVPAGDRDEPVGLLQRHGHRLLDEDVGPAREQLLGHLGVGGGGSRDDDGRRAPGEQLLHGAAADEPGGAVLPLDLGGHGVVRLDETDGLGEGKLGEDSGVVAAQVAAAGDSCLDLVGHQTREFSGATGPGRGRGSPAASRCARRRRGRGRRTAPARATAACASNRESPTKRHSESGVADPFRSQPDDRRVGLARSRLVGRRRGVDEREKAVEVEDPPRERRRRVRGDGRPDSPAPQLLEDPFRLDVRPDLPEVVLEEAGVRRLDLLHGPVRHVGVPVGRRPVPVDRVELGPRDGRAAEVDEHAVVDGEPGVLREDEDAVHVEEDGTKLHSQIFASGPHPAPRPAPCFGVMRPVTSGASMEARDYKATLQLPTTSFPMKADLPKREPERLARWVASGLYEKVLGRPPRGGRPPLHPPRRPALRQRAHPHRHGAQQDPEGHRRPLEDASRASRRRTSPAGTATACRSS